MWKCVNNVSFQTSESLYAHSGIMIRAFPEACFVVVTIDAPVGPAAPIPFPARVYKIVGDIAPAFEGIIKPSLTLSRAGERMITALIELSDHILGLYPPMTVGVR